MTDTPARVVLLGPQRDTPDLAGVMAELGQTGPTALITAGWQEWEEDDADLRAVLGADTVNVRLHARAERVWREDPELAQGHRRLQEDVQLLRRAYNVRLARAMEAWMEVEALEGDAGVLEDERAAALSAVQELDRHHAQRLTALRDAFYDRFDPLMRASVGRQRDELIPQVERARVVAIAGGHVPVLLNRLRLFGVDHLLAGKTVVAWSGGAMALTRRVVLFHDSPPWGPGHAEVGEVGLGLVPGIAAFPQASTRLRLDDPARVARMARRFHPDRCLLLDPGARVSWDGTWGTRNARRLDRDGTVPSWLGEAAA